MNTVDKLVLIHERFSKLIPQSKWQQCKTQIRRAAVSGDYNICLTVLMATQSIKNLPEIYETRQVLIWAARRLKMRYNKRKGFPYKNIQNGHLNPS